MTNRVIQILFYELTVFNSQQNDEVLQFKARYPSVEVHNKFSPEDYLGFYPMYYRVVIEDDTPLKTAFLLLFPQAKLRSITCSYASS